MADSVSGLQLIHSFPVGEDVLGMAHIGDGIIVATTRGVYLHVGGDFKKVEPMNEMVERVARVIGHEEGWLMIDPRRIDSPLAEWEWVSEDEHRRALSMAFAAIAAMREPTPEMKRVGYRNNGDYPFDVGKAYG